MLATAAVTVLIVVAAINAGLWQYGRYEDRADALRSYERASAQSVAPLDALIPPGASSAHQDAVWRTAVVSGEFSQPATTELRNRPVDSTPSIQYLAWFVTDAGAALLVNTGWAPAAEPGTGFTAPSRHVTLEVVLREFEEDDGRRDAGATRITVAQVPPPEAQTYRVYGMLRHTCVETECYYPATLNEVPLPYLSTGPHLSYAWQWWVFALLAPIGAVILLRRDAQDLAGGGSPRTKSRKPRALSDEEIEDAL